MNLADTKTVVEIAQGVVTTLAIIVAGIWTYYQFIKGRTFRENILIEVSELKRIKVGTNPVGILRITIKNIGGVGFELKKAYVEKWNLNKLEDDIDPDTQSDKIPIFTRGLYLEPKEEAKDEITIDLTSCEVFRIVTNVQDKRKQTWWRTSAIVTFAEEKKS